MTTPQTPREWYVADHGSLMGADLAGPFATRDEAVSAGYREFPSKPFRVFYESEMTERLGFGSSSEYASTYRKLYELKLAERRRLNAL